MHSICLKIRKRTGGGAASVMGFSFRALLFLVYADLCFFRVMGRFVSDFKLKSKCCVLIEIKFF
jgi:hypothetical protein